VPGIEAIWKGVRACGERLHHFPSLDRIGLAKLKQVFKRRRNSRRKHNAASGFDQVLFD